MARYFRKIKAWQLADRLAVEVYGSTKAFPKDEIYGLRSQIRRAAVSVPTNIVEGSARQHKREYLNFLYIAKGSLAEVDYLFHLANQLGYIGENTYHKMQDLIDNASKTLAGLIKSVEKEANNK